MKLKKYWSSLSATEKKAFAKKLKMEYLSMSNIAGGRANPSPALAINIEKITNGVVASWELRPDIFKRVR